MQPTLFATILSLALAAKQCVAAPLPHTVFPGKDPVDIYEKSNGGLVSCYRKDYIDCGSYEGHRPHPCCHYRQRGSPINRRPDPGAGESRVTDGANNFRPTIFEGESKPSAGAATHAG